MQTCDMVMSRSHGIKGGTSDDTFQALQELRGAPVGTDFFKFKDLLHG